MCKNKLINQENVVTIDTSNTRLGIKTANPLSELHVDGNVYITGKLFFENYISTRAHKPKIQI